MSAPLSTVPPPLSFTSLPDVCPTCKVVHRRWCPKFWEAYKQFNRELAVRVAGIKTPLPPRPPSCRAKHAFEETCSGCERERKRGAS